ncbi:hypothetical protein FOL47_008220 [Perkinsus chesapeaki]|uniref:Uncharacterized protein n=1 Tax=Perkinsus chesapeaki TaxID=330153 RepID=A0A7J6LFF5_PERCH|nr:hypothetical protein FOL47_008220 [Perkinsus chesapeaki]
MIPRILSILIIIVEAAGHSWVFNLIGDIKSGLPRHGANSHALPDHYFARPICPAPLKLSQCEDYPPPYKPLDASSQRPCRLAGSPGAPNTNNRAEVTRGGKLHISWMGNGHTNSVSDGTCVQIKIAPYKDDPSFDDFTTLEECHPYYNKRVAIDTTSATVKIPPCLPPGTYTIFYMWKFTGIYFATCSDIVIRR